MWYYCSFLDQFERANLPDVPVIYFVEPTIENILYIIEDLNQDRYDSFYINFTSLINRELLEEFAKKVSISGKSQKIKQVFDQYLDYIVTEPNLFSLNLPEIFTQFNSSNTDEEKIHKLVDVIANGLLSTIVSMDIIPVIRAQQNGPAEFVAQQLDLKLREYLSNTRGSTVATASIQQRPVLILLDRNFDLASMFSHSWIYQCMVSDVFQLQRNTIKITKHAAKDGEKDSTKNYDVDPKDFFWNKYSQLPFPDAVESADAELNAYKNDAKEVTAKTGISSLDDIDPNANATANIQQAVEKLPELTARKATLDMHMDILSSLINELQAKNLDKYFEIEQNATDPKVLKEFLELLVVDSERDSSLDKLRTFIILTLLVDLTPEYIEKVKSIFKEKYPQVDLSSFNYILKFKEHSKLANLSTLNETSNNFTNQASQMNSSALLSGLSSKLYGLTEGKISEGLTSIATRIKSFIPEKKLLPITTIVEAIMDPVNASQQSVQLTDEYVYLDPKSRGGHSKPPKRQSYQESLVFVVGGGNYLEYQNLQEWANDPNKAHRKVIYGSTEITSASEFLEECSVLGS